MERFWPANRNKHKLKVLLHQDVIKHAVENPSNIRIYTSNISDESEQVPCLSCCDGSLLNRPELSLDIEEADSRILPHAFHAAQQGVKKIVMLSPDTDVFVLLLHYWDILHLKGLCELWLKTGSGSTTRYIALHSLAETSWP